MFGGVDPKCIEENEQLHKSAVFVHGDRGDNSIMITTIRTNYTGIPTTTSTTTITIITSLLV